MEGEAKYSTVPQLPAEYDDLMISEASFTHQREFSNDINKRMKVPERLSVDGTNLHELEVENMRANMMSTRLADMAVPDKITLTGPVDRDPVNDPYDTMKSEQYVNITTPPRVLTVEERFPAVDDSSDEGGVNNTTNASAHILSLLGKNSDAIQPLNNSGIMDQDSRLSALESRLKQLELLEQRRRTQERLVYPTVVIYILYRVMRWMLDR